MTDASQQEPSMEEILASIRRIISEEGDGGKPAAAPAAATVAPPAPAAERRPAPAAAPRPAAPPHAGEGDEVLELSRPMAPPPAPVMQPQPASPQPYRYQAQPVSPQPESRPSPSTGDDELMSAVSAGAASAAFASLSGGIAASGAGLPQLGEAGRTLEDLVRDMLRPLLKAWLDQNLPPLVERMVRAEIDRLSRRG